mmetsp:Transcript_39082/g.70415  ORF Transcript_39082/g.70415 Transcript_39082/m.70415 type:complete len:212 (+) Transcript_39082:463-1098(+)
MVIPLPSLPAPLQCSSRRSLPHFPKGKAQSHVCCRDSSYEISTHLPNPVVQLRQPPQPAAAPFALQPSAAVRETASAVPSSFLPCSVGSSRVVGLPTRRHQQRSLLPVSSADPMPCCPVSPLLPMRHRLPLFLASILLLLPHPHLCLLALLPCSGGVELPIRHCLLASWATRLRQWLPMTCPVAPLLPRNRLPLLTTSILLHGPHLCLLTP